MRRASVRHGDPHRLKTVAFTTDAELNDALHSIFNRQTDFFQLEQSPAVRPRPSLLALDLLLDAGGFEE